jgi:hypothetical protein
MCWPRTGPRGRWDAHLMIGVSYFSKKSITIILSFHIAIHCSNLVCFLGFDYDGGWCHQNVDWNFDTLGCFVVNLRSRGTPLLGSAYQIFPSKASFKAEGGRGGLEIRVRATGVCIPGSYQVRLGVQEEWCQEDGWEEAYASVAEGSGSGRDSRKASQGQKNEVRLLGK